MLGFARETDQIYQADTSFHWLSRKDYFKGLNDLWVVFLDDAIVGFTGIRLIDGAGERIVYIDNMNIRSVPLRVFGHHTIGSMLVHEILRTTYPLSRRPMSVVFRTQNPSVYRLANAIHPTGVYPRTQRRSARDPERCKRVLAFMAERLSPGKAWDPEVSVIRGAYAGHLYGRPVSAPASIKPPLARFWQENVDLDAGDAVLIAVCPTNAEVRAIVHAYIKGLTRDALATRWRSVSRTTPAERSAAAED
ncbi:hypothetical protein GCM10011521_20310 [Arenimonas soli]|uniref:N-acetyltransferase domain-containing protein n=1 Tax=Arenimonas soli TaxID=2269504 RepID=A0ABQ1HM10_9GAMM|nr:hypothetical protein GCM10011521_20310 [Arenimonas soli]